MADSCSKCSGAGLKMLMLNDEMYNGIVSSYESSVEPLGTASDPELALCMHLSFNSVLNSSLRTSMSESTIYLSDIFTKMIIQI